MAERRRGREWSHPPWSPRPIVALARKLLVALWRYLETERTGGGRPPPVTRWDGKRGRLALKLLFSAPEVRSGSPVRPAVKFHFCERVRRVPLPGPAVTLLQGGLETLD
jgi:hypothetical protein